MKKLYITPESLVVNYQGQQMLAQSSVGQARITGETAPSGEHLEDIGTGSASDAAVKGMWDY